MTIFHVLKYQISFPPTIKEFGELDTLENKTFRQWAKDVGFGSDAKIQDMAEWYEIDPDDAVYDLANKEIDLLRQFLLGIES